mgnify:CR=1 FL=1|jgi:hypothetical protein
MTEKRLVIRILSGILLHMVLGYSTHGKYIESNATLNVFYSIWGINRDSTVELNSKQGFVLIYMSHGLKLLSIIKSKPKTSKQYYIFDGLI